jgi:ATP-binding cassette subfamily F protein uup
MAAHDQGDYAGLGVLSTELSQLETAISTLEVRWLELSELLA